MQNKTYQRLQPLNRQKYESLKVLIVDDEPSIIETLQIFLQSMNIHFIHDANCGEKALEYVDKIQYDYIFIDLMMPGMNGIEFLKNIQHYHHLTSVIIMTGYPSMNAVIDAMHNGASDFLVKPFRVGDIEIIFQRLQKLHRLREKNWCLHQELEEKKKVEDLNRQLSKKIQFQTILFNIVNSLSEMSYPDDIYIQS